MAKRIKHNYDKLQAFIKFINLSLYFAIYADYTQLYNMLMGNLYLY